MTLAFRPSHVHVSVGRNEKVTKALDSLPDSAQSEEVASVCWVAQRPKKLLDTLIGSGYSSTVELYSLVSLGCRINRFRFDLNCEVVGDSIVPWGDLSSLAASSGLPHLRRVLGPWIARSHTRQSGPDRSASCV